MAVSFTLLTVIVIMMQEARRSPGPAQAEKEKHFPSFADWASFPHYP
jgi:hypothetical protein